MRTRKKNMPREMPIQKPGECLDMLFEGRTAMMGGMVGEATAVVVFASLREERRW